MKTIFKLRLDEDTVEGKGPWTEEGYFIHEIDARMAGRLSKHTYIGGLPAWDVEPVFLYETFADYQNTKNDTIKEQALAKLSSEEKQALGL